MTKATRLHPWPLVVCLLVLALNAYLTLSLSPWYEEAIVAETLVAAGLAIAGLVRLGHGKGPTPLEILVLLSLASVWLLNPLRPLVLDRRIESIGTELLLSEARWLTDEAGVAWGKPALRLDGQNLLVPKSLQALHPESVRIEFEAVTLVLKKGISSEEAVVIYTNPKIVPGPVQPQPEIRLEENGGQLFKREIAPGIEWHSFST